MAAVGRVEGVGMVVGSGGGAAVEEAVGGRDAVVVGFAVEDMASMLATIPDEITEATDTKLLVLLIPRRS